MKIYEIRQAPEDFICALKQHFPQLSTFYC